MAMDLRAILRTRDVTLTPRIGEGVADLGLTVDQTVEGRVVQSTDNRALIRLAGRELLAQTRATLQPGELVQLQVRDVRPDRVILQIVGRGEGQGTLRALGEADLARLLEGQGLVPGRDNLLIARALIGAGLPIDRQVMERLAGELARAGGNPEADADTAAYLRARNLPITQATLALARAHLARPNALAEDIRTIGQQLTVLLDTLDASAPDAPSDAFSDSSSSDVAPRNAVSRPGAQPAGEAGPAVPGSAGPAHEAGNHALARLPQLARDLLAALPVVSSTEARGSVELAPRLQQLVDALGTSLEHRLEQLGQSPDQPEAAGLDRDLRALLAQVIEGLDAELAAPRETSRPPQQQLQTLRDATAGLLQAVEHQQMANAAEPSRPAENYYLLQIPIAAPGARGSGQPAELAELRIFRRQHGAGQIDADNAHVVFRFDLQHLGPTEVDLLIRNRRVGCRISSATPEISHFIDERRGELEQGLAGLGYAVADLRCTTTPSPAASATAQPAAAMAPTRVLKIDLRA
ncbi:MAG: flagellar hook-length control protein FliK [Chloroflexi bacterium]|nr:flagellar hook-length control protein FliK [Chloroflexota bacterium]